LFIIILIIILVNVVTVANITTLYCNVGLADLVFIELAVLVLLFAFVLEGDDDEADKDVDHEEGDDNDVDEVEDGDDWSMVVDGTVVGRVRVHAFVHQSITQRRSCTSQIKC